VAAARADRTTTTRRARTPANTWSIIVSISSRRRYPPGESVIQCGQPRYRAWPPMDTRRLAYGGVVALLCTCVNAQVAAQDRVMKAVRTSNPVVLDGVLDEEPWGASSPAADFVQSEPREGEPASERTEVRIIFDDDALYIGAWCFDRDPAGIIANSLRTDFPPSEEDTFEVLLDTFADSRGGVLFVTNPNGAKRDVQIASEGALQNVDWDAVWDVATRINDQGWFVEMRIPFNSLRYYSPITKSWKVNFGRRIRRHNETTFWTTVPRRFDITRVSLAGELAGMDGEQVRPGRNLSVKPYAASRFGSAGDGATADGDLGMDVKYGVTNGLTLDLTVNPDFAQVEVDNQVVNLDRFSIFFPEKRDFFLENQGVLQIGTLGKAPSSLDPEDVVVFYSRRIGLSANRNPVPIMGGARLTGRAGAYQMGFLSLETDEGEGQGRENASAFRVKRDFFARSEVGGFFLNRQGPERLTNRTYGVDAVLRPTDDLLFNLLHSRTHTPGIESDDAATRLEVEYDITNLRLFAVQTDIGDNYRNDLGFVKQTGARVSRLELMPRFRPGSGGLVREIAPHYNGRYMTDQGGSVLLRKHTLETNVTFRDGALVRVSYRDYYDRLQEDFEIQDGVIIPEGGYNYGDYTVLFSSDPSRRFSGSATYVWGDFWNGEKKSYSVSARVRPNARLNTEVTLSQDDVDLPGGAFRATVSRLRFGYAMSTRAFLDAFLQYNSEDRHVTSNIRFNVIHRPLSDIFVVYTEDRPTFAGTDTNRVLSLKYTHLLAF
jgi:hypothetical protein